MKRVVLVLGTLALLAAPVGASSGIGVLVGYWDADDADDEIGLGVKIDVDFGGPVHLELRGTAFEEFTGDREEEDEAEQGDVDVFFPFELEIFPFEIGLAYHFSEGARIDPFVGGGLGFYEIEIKRFEPNLSAQVDDEAGWYVVAGANFEIHQRWSVFVEGLFRSLDAEIEGEGFRDFDTLGFELSGAAANVGILYTF